MVAIHPLPFSPFRDFPRRLHSTTVLRQVPLVVIHSSANAMQLYAVKYWLINSSGERSWAIRVVGSLRGSVRSSRWAVKGKTACYFLSRGGENPCGGKERRGPMYWAHARKRWLNICAPTWMGGTIARNNSRKVSRRRIAQPCSIEFTRKWTDPPPWRNRRQPK